MKKCEKAVPVKFSLALKALLVLAQARERIKGGSNMGRLTPSYVHTPVSKDAAVATA